MRRRRPFGVLAGVVVSLAVCALASRAVAQAGSTGGSVGKRDKSVSGVEDAPAPRPPVAPTRRQQRAAPEAGASASVNGSWRWSCTCSSGKAFHGTFNFVQTGNSFSGVMPQSEGATGQVSDGKVSGGRVSFTVSLTNVIARTEHWTGRLNGGHMQGTLTTRFDGDCEFTADR
jgi:hypothetical protein